MEKIPTAEELLTNILSNLKCFETISFLKSEDGKSDLDDLITLINSRTNLHVKAALKAASEDADMIGETQHNNNAPDDIKDFVYVIDNNGPDYGLWVSSK